MLVWVHQSSHSPPLGFHLGQVGGGGLKGWRGLEGGGDGTFANDSASAESAGMTEPSAAATTKSEWSDAAPSKLLMFAPKLQASFLQLD